MDTINKQQFKKQFILWLRNKNLLGLLPSSYPSCIHTAVHISAAEHVCCSVMVLQWCVVLQTDLHIELHCRSKLVIFRLAKIGNFQSKMANMAMHFMGNF